MTHLIVTALKEFWPREHPSILMGPWCQPGFFDNQHNKTHQLPILPSPWSDKVALEKAQISCEETYLSLLSVLSRVLNTIHGTSYANKYWQILVGPWLNWFVQIVSDRLARLELAVEQCSDLMIIGLDHQSFVTPISTLDFVYWAKDDLYNLQLVTRLAENMGINIECFRKPEKEFTLTKPRSPLSARSVGGLRPTIRGVYKNIYRYLETRLSENANIVLHASYHPRSFLIKIFLLSKGKIANYSDSSVTLTHMVLDVAKRSALGKLLLNETALIPISSFQGVVLSLLEKELPLVFLEGYSQLETLAADKFNYRAPKAICSANGWYFDELFKHWGAKSASRGTKLFGLQHGGNYGVNSPMPYERHERAIVDGYLTWGWSEKQSRIPIVPTPAQKLLDIKRYTHVKKCKKIIFTGSALARYFIEFPYLPEQFQEYLEWQRRFFTAIDKATLPLICVRLHYEDHGWEIQKRLEQISSVITFENWDRTFRESLSDCRLYIGDHLSTTYAEALASNTPTVMFFDPETNPIRLEAQPFFDGLRRVGILHDTPESAAAWVDRVYEDIDAWWTNDECQRVVKNFCWNYARVEGFSTWKWFNIFKKLFQK
jgi:putative transferase (TIGR04331 family)